MKLKNLLIPFIALSLAACSNSNPPSENPPTPPEEEEELPEPSIDDYYQEAIKGYTPKEKIDVDPFNRTYVKLTSDGAYVRKVNNLTDENYILGVDASSVIAEENSGVKYYDFQGNEADVFKVLSDSGVNYIRVRVWNDPYDENGNGYGGGNNDIEKAIAIGKRATQYNMSLLVDFHYSDFWADPAKQMRPKAWASMKMTQVKTALYEYTKSSLQSLKDAGVKVGMVQIGNETNGGNMCGFTGLKNFVSLATEGSKAVREVLPDALVAVHFAGPNKYNNYLDWAERIKTLDYDVFGSSFYPYWHGTLDNLAKTLSTIAAKYDKRVMVMETAYAYSTEDTDASGANQIGETSGYDKKDYPFTIHGQINNFVDVLDTIVNKTINGLGVCYWEGTWISVNPNNNKAQNQEIWERYGSGWASSYSSDYDPDDAGKFYGGCAVENQALFDEHGHPLESLKMFNLVRFGNTHVEDVIDGVKTVEMLKETNEEFTLPTTVPAVYRSNRVEEIAVTWEDFDIAAKKALGNGRYEIEGTAGGFKTICKLSIMEHNFLENYSFETGTAKKWRLVTTDVLNNNHIIKVTNENPLTGRYAYHFWTSDDSGVDFELEQDVTGLKEGTYKLQASFLGGGEGTSEMTKSQDIYIYIKINDVLAKKQSHTIKGWNDKYQDALLEGVNVPANAKVTVGVHVKVPGANYWGDIDDVMLNAVL